MVDLCQPLDRIGRTQGYESWVTERTDRWVLVRTISLPPPTDVDWAQEQTAPASLPPGRFSRLDNRDLLGDDPDAVRFYFVCAKEVGGVFELVRGANDLELDLALVFLNDEGHAISSAPISQTSAPGVNGVRLGYLAREPHQGFGFQSAIVRVNGHTGAGPNTATHALIYASRVTAREND